MSRNLWIAPIVGLTLLAPACGSDAVQNAKDRASEAASQVVDDATAQLGELSDAAGKAVEDARGQLGDLAPDAKAQAESALGEAQTAIDDAKKAVDGGAVGDAGRQARDSARAELEQAKQQIEDTIASQPTIGDRLDGLTQQLDELTGSLAGPK